MKKPDLMNNPLLAIDMILMVVAPLVNNIWVQVVSGIAVIVLTYLVFMPFHKLYLATKDMESQKEEREK